MRSEKRYNLERNRDFNSQRSTEDRRAYRAALKASAKAYERAWNAGPEAFHAFLARQAAYFDALLKHGNRAASFPKFADWEGR